MGKYQQFLNEMAFNRSQLLKKIDEQNVPLMEHTLCLFCFGEISNCDKTVAHIINSIAELYDIKEHRKYLSKKDLLDILLYNPYEDSDEEWIELKAKRLSKSKNMKIKSTTTFAELQEFYSEVLEFVSSGGLYGTDVQKILNKIKRK